MKVEPGGEELLRVARETLLEALLPRLPEEDRYAARMVANAMAIAAREMQAGGRATGGFDEARLAADIRAGRYDAPMERPQLLATLRELVRTRLAVSNPRVLERKP